MDRVAIAVYEWKVLRQLAHGTIIACRRHFDQELYGLPGVAIPMGLVPARKGDPKDTSAPVPGVMLKPDTLPPPFAVYKNCPFGSMVIPFGEVPAENVDPPLGDSAPVDPLIVNTDTSLEP